MKRCFKFFVALLILIPKLHSQAGPPLKLIESIPLPLEGYIDHMSIDIKRQRLFIPGEQQHTIEVVDLQAGKVVYTIKEFGGNPRKTVYLPATDEIWVDDGDGTCKAFSGETYKLTKTIPLSDFKKESVMIPDNGAYDPSSHQFYIAITADAAASSIPAGSKGAVAIVDTTSGKYLGQITVDGSDPAGIAVDPATPRIFVVMGDTAQVVVIDRQKRAVLDSWPIVGGPQPHTVALDAANHRLFVGSRVRPGHLYEPGKMVVMDTDTGKVVQALDAVGGADEILYDAPSHRVYFAGTTGYVDVFKQIDKDHYELLAKIPTGALAKTAILVPELKRFYVAVPKHIILTPPIPQSREATIEESKLLVFEVLP